MDFKMLELNEQLINGLIAQGIDQPTQVQELAIPEIMQNKDAVIQSETGSGKTLAYLLPIYLRSSLEVKGAQAIVLVPTHELAMQVHHQVQTLSQNSGISFQSLPLCGDANINKQIEKLREKPQIIIGTTVRILELIKKKKLSVHTVKTVVVDEADKMLDKQNMQGVQTLLKCVMRDTQILLFSASISQATIQKAEQITKNPQIIKTAEAYKIPENIQHIYFVVDQRDKIETLRKLTNIINTKRALVFINKAEDIEIATAKLQYNKLSAACIYGENTKEQRKKTLTDFTNGKLHYLIATDIAARGLHIDGVTTVFNLSIPEKPMDYLHRAGRAGRDGTKGLSVLIVSKREVLLIEKYQRAFGITISEKRMYEGKIVDKKQHKK